MERGEEHKKIFFLFFGWGVRYEGQKKQWGTLPSFNTFRGPVNFWIRRDSPIFKVISITCFFYWLNGQSCLRVEKADSLPTELQSPSLSEEQNSSRVFFLFITSGLPNLS